MIQQIPAKLHPISGDVAPKLTHFVKNNLQDAAKSKIEADKAQFPSLARGDTVRVQLVSIDAAIRAQIKSGMNKGYIAQWSQEIYKIKSVSKSKSEFIKSRYQLENLNGVFGRDQLQLVGNVDKIKTKTPKVTFTQPAQIQMQPLTQLQAPAQTKQQTRAHVQARVLRPQLEVAKVSEPEWEVEAILGEKKEGRN